MGYSDDVGPWRRSLAGIGCICVVAACAQVVGLDGYSVDESTAPTNTPPTATLPGGVVVSPVRLDLPDVTCGATTGKSVTLNNTGDAPVTYEVRLSESSGLTLAGGAFTKTDTLNAKSSAAIDVVVAASSVPREITDDLIITVSEEVLTVPIHGVVKGGRLTLTPAAVDFGEVHQDTTSTPATIEIANVGNEAVSVTGVAPPNNTDFSLEPSTLALGPGEKKTASVTLTAGPAGSLLSAELSLTTQSPTCGEPPKLVLQGTRVNKNVTVSTSAVDLGDLDCNSTPTAKQTIEIANYSLTSAANVTATLQSGAASVYAVSPPSAIVPVADAKGPGKATFTITSKPVNAALGVRSEQLSFAITGPDQFTKLVSLKSNVAGAIVSITPTTLTSVGTGGKPFTVTNMGNKLVYLEHNASTTSIIVSPTNTSLNPGASTSVNARIKVHRGTSGTVMTTRVNGPFGAPAGAVLCTPAPNVIVN